MALVVSGARDRRCCVGADGIWAFILERALCCFSAVLPSSDRLGSPDDASKSVSTR